MDELTGELLGLPAQASAHAGEIDQMIIIIHYLMAVLFVGWGAFYIYTLIRFRASANPKADYTGVTSHTSTYLEWGVAAIEAVLLVGFAIPAWAHRVNDVPPDEQATVVNLISKQFEWISHYPGEDGRFGQRDLSLTTPTNVIGLDRNSPNGADDIVTINQLNMPVDKPIIVYLSSQDVIHSFAIAEMRVKQDAIPGIQVPVWWVPTEVGDYEVNCSQLCGLGHYRMRGFASVMTQADYDAWLAEEASFLTGN